MTTEDTVTDAQTLADLRAEIESLRKENASYRVSRNDALKRSKAYQTVIKAHNINFSTDEADLSSLAIDDGQVTGDFAYSPPTVQTNIETPRDMGSAPKAMTLDDVDSMSEQEINANWEEISQLMARNGREILNAQKV